MSPHPGPVRISLSSLKKALPGRMEALRKIGVPYTLDYVDNGVAMLEEQAEEVAARLKAQGKKDADPNKEIIALIAYLKRLGTDIAPKPHVEE